ncbi:MAG TPA: substrate-binding domain-containing protein [Thermoguttaceae bacterium]|nr:substrate-binding domain-containing protein [Thermoguttaceae bacterium]
MRRIATVLVAGVCLVGLATGGCRQASDGDGSDKLTIAVIPKCTSHEFWKTVEIGAREAAEAYGVEMKWEGASTETDLAEQNKIIENMINLDVDGIALAPLNRQAMRKRVEDAVAAGIPVVIFDSPVDGTAHSSFVATDNEQGGVLGARHMLELLDGQGDVLVLRYIQGAGSTEDRAEGFITTAEAGGIRVVANPYCEDGEVSGAKKTSTNTLEGFIEGNRLRLDGIFCCNDRSSLGMLDALEDLRKSGIEIQAKFICFDFAPDLVAGLQQGKIDAMVAQNPRKMGYLAVETLVKHLRKEPIEKTIDTGAELVTMARLEKEPDLRQLIGADEP